MGVEPDIKRRIIGSHFKKIASVAGNILKSLRNNMTGVTQFSGRDLLYYFMAVWIMDILINLCGRT